MHLLFILLESQTLSKVEISAFFQISQVFQTQKVFPSEKIETFQEKEIPGLSKIWSLLHL